MNTIGIIPCRMASTRFPGKPLVKILNMPMTGHIYKRSKMAKKLTDLYVATCDKEIFDYVESIGGKAIMTADTHERATERVGEAIDKIEAKTGEKADIVVMIQGDEPMIHPDTVDAMIEPFLADENVQTVNLTNKIGSDEEYNKKDIVKLIYDQMGRIVWFFRQPSPFWADKVRELPIDIQTGIIAFRGQALTTFNNLATTPFEKVNSVDMSRFIEHGHVIHTVSSDKRLYSVDTPEDLQVVEEKMKEDDLISQYA